jgi:hypothetical protein
MTITWEDRLMYRYAWAFSHWVQPSIVSPAIAGGM